MVERRTFLTGIAAVGAATLIGCARDDDAPQPGGSPSPRPSSGKATPLEVDPVIDSTIASGLNVPWGIVFLANGDALVSQRDDHTVVRISTAGKVTTVGEVAGVAGPTSGGEGGLLGIALAPGDEDVLFAYISTSTDNRLVRMSLTDDRLGSPKPLVTGVPTSLHHHGGRLLFDDDGMLFVSTGDAEQGDRAQDKESLAGKILRVDQDGRPAPGNPFDNEVYSYGHRNVEGLAFDAGKRLWATEFGEKKADELNLIERGKNYGWPDVEGQSDSSDSVDPHVTWGTDEASPAGIAIARSTAFVGALQGECVFAVPLDGRTAGKPKAFFTGKLGRIRNVFTAPDGALWVTTSNTDGRREPGEGDDRILRVTL